MHALYFMYRSKLRGLFEKFVDSPYYSESELCGGAVTVSFSKYLARQAMNFLQRSTHFSKTCCRQLITSKFLALELPFHGWKSPEIAWDEMWTVWRMFPSWTQNSIQISSHAISRLFRPCKGRSEYNIVIHLWGIGWEVVDRIYLAQDGDHWSVLVKTVMNPKRWGISWLAERLLASQELHSMELFCFEQLFG
jgi:hypothetical protein